MKKHPRLLHVLEPPARAGDVCSKCHLQGDGCPALEVFTVRGRGAACGTGHCSPHLPPPRRGGRGWSSPGWGGHSPACPYPAVQRLPARSHSCGARVRDALRREEPGLEQHCPPALLEPREALSAAGGQGPSHQRLLPAGPSPQMAAPHPPGSGGVHIARRASTAVTRRLQLLPRLPPAPAGSCKCSPRPAEPGALGRLARRKKEVGRGLSSGGEGVCRGKELACISAV